MTPPDAPDAPEADKPKPFRVLPRLDDANRHFWTGGAEGELRFRRCADCGYWLHPAGPRCPQCLSKNLVVEATSGKAIVHTYSVDHQPWYPNLDPPYVVAIVELPEQAGLRLTTNLFAADGSNLDEDTVTIGMPVTVFFEQYDDVWLPFFKKDPS